MTPLSPRPARRANLAVWLLCVMIGAWAVAQEQPVEDKGGARSVEPVRVEFRLGDGVQIEGVLTSWDRDGFDGSFGRRFWHELQLNDARSLFHRVMDRESAEHWLDFARVLLQHGAEGERLAEAALRRAVEIDADVEPRIAPLREEVSRLLKERAERAQRAGTGRLMTTSPEAKEWPSDPWPALTPQEQQAARLTMIADAEALKTNGSIDWPVVESEHFLIYSDAPRTDVAVWAVRWFDRGFRDIAGAFGVDPKQPHFWGKPVVFIFEDDEAFRVFEASMFNQYVPRDRNVISHYEGPKTFILGSRLKDDVLLHASLRREIAHIFLHRFVSPRRLPPWAHEGTAEYFAQQVIDESVAHEGLRQAALQLVRGGYPFGELLLKTWAEDSWQGPRERGYPICHLFIDYLKNIARGSFIDWVKACKKGDDWREAMARFYGGDIAGFAGAFYRFYRVND